MQTAYFHKVKKKLISNFDSCVSINVFYTFLVYVARQKVNLPSPFPILTFILPFPKNPFGNPSPGQKTSWPCDYEFIYIRKFSSF